MTADKKDRGQRKHRLVVLGATGFTGKQAAHWFRRWIATHQPGMPWCVAGRDQAKLALLLDELGSEAAPDVVVLDTADKEACLALARTCDVLLTTVGPYARYGEHVVAACAQSGTDYVDITGETPWVRAMIDRYEPLARDTGAKIVPLCGFDSIPSDVGAYITVRALQQAGDDPLEVRSLYSLRGGLNGGTLASALYMMEQKQGRMLYDPHLLTPQDGRRYLAKRQPADARAPQFSEPFGGWTTPFVMAPINARVVRRSAALLGARGEGYGDTFRYSEAMKASGRVAAWGVGLSLAAMNGLGASAMGRSLLSALGPKPGQGPSEATMDGGGFRARFWGQSKSGTIARGEVSSAGDPGNRVTVNLLCTCATLLLQERARLPEGAGFLTPITAFGELLIERMRALGMTVVAEVVTSSSVEPSS